MANFNTVNKAVKKAFPNRDVRVVRGEGYVYFLTYDDDRWDVIDSIMTNPTTTPTADLIRMSIESIEDFYS